MSFEFGIFHEFSAPCRTDGRRGVRPILRPGRRGRALGPRRRLARGVALPAGAIGRLRAPGARQRHRHAHAPPENRHCRAGAAAVPPAAVGGGGGDARSHQPGAPHLRRRPQRLSAHLRGLWRTLRREPRALRRGARDPRALLDARSASPSRAASTSIAISRSSRGRCRSHIRRCASRRRAPDTYPAIGAMGLPIFVAVRLGTIEELGPNIAAYREAYRAAGHAGQGEVYLRVPIYVGETEASARADPEHSIMPFYRTLGAQLEDSATRAGARAIEQRAERGQALQTISYEDVLRDKVIVGTPATVASAPPGADHASSASTASWRSSTAAASSPMTRSCARCSSCARRSRRGSGNVYHPGPRAGIHLATRSGACRWLDHTVRRRTFA